MKYLKLLLLINSCADKEGVIEVISGSSLYDDRDFTDSEGNTYSTGGSCDMGSSDYKVNTNLINEEIDIIEDLSPSLDLSYLLPPVDSQGSQGSCVSWAISYYLKSFQEKLQHNYDYTQATIMSPAFTYNQITQGNCSGTDIELTFEILKEKGCVTLESFPYNSNNCSIQPTALQYEEAIVNKIKSYHALSGDENIVLEIKSLLTNFIPIVISTTLDSEFGVLDEFGLTAYRDHKVDYTNSACHAMLIVGYSDNYNAFKVVNSWGDFWGNEGGYVWIDYKAFENISIESADFKVINGAYYAIDEL